MANRNDLQVQKQLVAIGEARMALAKARLSAAEQQRLDCASATGDAARAADEAFDSWLGCVGSPLLGPGALQATGNRLLAAESQLIGARKLQEAAEREADDRARDFQEADARQRGQTGATKRLERRINDQAAERLLDELSDLWLARRASS